MKCIYLFTALLSLSAHANQAKPHLPSESIQALEHLTSVEGNLKQGESYSYLIDATKNSFIFGEVEQVSVDVKVQIFDPSGLEILAFNNTKVGYEPFTVDTQMSGQYKVTLSAKDENSSGSYSIRLIRNESIADDPNKRLEQLLSPYDKKTTPGAVFGVFENANVKCIHSVGMANLAHNIPFETDMPTNIGSVSKQFTAMAMLLLEQQGKLSLDDNIRKHISELPEFTEKVTIKNILTHTTGLREIFNLLGMRGWTGEEFIEKNQAIEIVKKQTELQAAPGEKMNYNNTGFILLTLIVERVTETSYADWMHDNIFAPLDMNSTYVRRDPGHIIPRATQGYGVDENGFREVGDLYSAPGAGAMYTTVADMAKWSQNYITGKLGGKEVISKLTTPGVLNDGTEQTYALGLGVSKHKGRVRYAHGGGDMAHFTRYAFFPEIEKGLFLNTNSTAFNMSIWGKVVDLIIGEDVSQSSDDDSKDEGTSFSLSPEQLAKLVGKYNSELLGVTVDIKASDKQLTMAFSGGDAQPLMAVSETEFTFNEGQYKLAFLKNDGKVSGITMKFGSNDYEFKKLEVFNPTKEQLNEYTGRYFSDELEVLYTIAINEENKLTVKLYTLPAMELTPLQQDTFSESTKIYTDLNFIRDENGEVSKIELSNGRTQGVMFERMP